MLGDIDIENKETLRDELKDRHKLNCIQLLHGKTHKCNCDLQELTELVLALYDAGEVLIQISKKIKQRKMEN